MKGLQGLAQVPRIPIPRTPVNRGKKREGRGGSRPRFALALRLRNVYRSSKTVEAPTAQMHSVPNCLFIPKASVSPHYPVVLADLGVSHPVDDV
jgi:hypothetical protein